jgi:hypothetical protein
MASHTSAAQNTGSDSTPVAVNLRIGQQLTAMAITDRIYSSLCCCGDYGLMTTPSAINPIDITLTATAAVFNGTTRWIRAITIGRPMPKSAYGDQPALRTVSRIGSSVNDGTRGDTKKRPWDTPDAPARYEPESPINASPDLERQRAIAMAQIVMATAWSSTR